MPATPFYRREDVENKPVLDTSGKGIGTGQDLAFSLDGKLAIVVKTPKGEDIEIPMTRIVGVADYIVLTPETLTQAKQPSLQPQGSAPTNVQETCPNCGMPLKSGVKFCTHCGIRESATATQTQIPQTSQKPETCTNCGMPLKPNAKFCTGCGVKLSSLDSGHSVISPKS